MTTQNPEEVLARYTAALGDEFGTAYYQILSEWSDLWLTWRQFENLFGHGPERVELMNRAGASFFYRVDRLFFESVALAVCRLSDPIKSAGKSNLTIRLFEKYMDTNDRKAKMQELLNEVISSTEFARDWRNRKISHNDYALKIGAAEPLQKASRNSMNAAIASLHLTLAYVSTELMESYLDNEVINDMNDEMVMLHRLFLGDEQFQKELKELKETRTIGSELPKWVTNLM